MPKPAASIIQHFGEGTDPRIERQKLHQLFDIVVIAICAVICGADNTSHWAVSLNSLAS